VTYPRARADASAVDEQEGVDGRGAVDGEVGDPTAVDVQEAPDDGLSQGGAPRT
jgi:hypothetical protein